MTGVITTRTTPFSGVPGFSGLLGLVGGLVSLIAGGVTAVSVPQPSTITGGVALTAGLGDGTALVMGPGGWPVPGDVYTAAVDDSYLRSLGFTGDTVQVNLPWSNLLAGSWDDRVQAETEGLVEAVTNQLQNGTYDAARPLVIVGYSESAVAASRAMEQLHDDGVATDLLHFVLIGDTASPEGGFLGGFLPSLPGWLREIAESVLVWSGLKDLVGVTTPTDLYPTDIYTLPGDMWSDWPAQLPSDPLQAIGNTARGFFTHLEYIGLTPEQVAAAELTGTHDLINYHTIPDDGLKPLDVLWNTVVNMGDVPEWLLKLIG